MLVVINPCNLYMSSDYYLSISHYQYRMPLDTDLYILDTDDLIVEKVSYTKLLEIYKRDITSFSINNLKYRNHKDYEGIGLKTSIDILNKSYALEATLFNSEDLRIKLYNPLLNTDLELLIYGKFYHIEFEYDYRSFDDHDSDFNLVHISKQPNVLDTHLGIVADVKSAIGAKYELIKGTLKY